MVEVVRRRVPTRTRLLLVVLLAGVVLALAAGVLLSAAVDRPGSGAGGTALPQQLLGLPARQDGPAREAVAGLADRLARDPVVAEVSVGAYHDGRTSLVVLRLVPREAMDDATAARLTTEVLGASGTERGPAADLRSRAGADGEAVVTCSSPAPGASTCVAVEPAQALLVLLSGAPGDPLAATEEVRDVLSR